MRFGIYLKFGACNLLFADYPFDIHNRFSVLCKPRRSSKSEDGSSVICHLFSFICHLFSFICHLFSFICPLTSVI
ncbi:hypothetical protein D1AOALGA4SA_452 [Olavius algarvensis Delta 1 endosymbiont]|nr:hypothetical protein D1AOALGA4SA_452 [Olavius algarvensis Delta 1 endosymbiont]